MTKKNLFLVALAAVAFAACSDDFAEAPPVVTPTPEAREIPMVFNSASSALTRADITGAKAADMLDKQFVVSGYKGAKTETTSPNIVFENFLVKWTENTANTTESNTNNWEYVGIDPIKHATDKGVTQQTIKYWDYSQDQYDFIAWSTGKKTAIYEGTPAAGEVLVSAIDPSTAKTAAYTFTGTAADLSQCYIADLVTVKKDGSTTTKYAEPVVLKFRSLGTKVRIGIYETVPGYSVRNVKFYPKAGVLDAASDINTEAKIFTTTANDVYTAGTYTVLFPTVDKPADSDNNQAHIKFQGTGTQSTIVTYGTLNYTIAENAEKTTGDVFLGRTSNTATFAGDPDMNYYTFYLPNEGGTNFNLRVDFTLESIDGTGEIIEVKNASAQVPLIYTQWKPGFAYTYLFKISDKTNGRTGNYDPTKPDDHEYNSDPAGLYPITFDAVVVDAEDNGHTQETITTITTPSITTYQQASTVVDANEYTANGNKIYVTVNENDALVALKDETSSPAIVKAALYTIVDNKTTEAEVVDAMQMQDDYPASGTIKGRSGLVLTETTFEFTDKVEYGVDGNVIKVGTNEALSFSPTSGKTYAFVYTQTAPDEAQTVEKFQPVTKAAGASVKGLYRWGLKNAPAGDVQEGVTYFYNKTSGQQDVFLGQIVNNLYLDDHGTIASGYAKTGTTYYYTTDKGQSYKAAAVIDYAGFENATDIFILDGTEYKPKTDASPVPGKAYYKRTGNGTTDPYVFTYGVIYPQQTNGTPRLMIENTARDRVACEDDEIAYSGMSYFDKYTMNNGVYYAKVIKVQ